MAPTPEQVADARAVIDAAQAATGLSLARLAAALGVSNTALHRWRAGTRAMDETARRLCRAYTLVPELVGALSAEE